MPFTVYIIFSPSLNQYYIGHTADIEDRLFRHRNRGSMSTKKANDWELKYTDQFETRSAAMQREMELKSKKSRVFLEALINVAGLRH